VALGNKELRPRADNDLVTLHAVPSVPADLFYKSYQECTGLEPACRLDPVEVHRFPPSKEPVRRTGCRPGYRVSLGDRLLL